MKRPCLYSSASSNENEVTSITILRFAGDDMRRINYLLLEVVPWRGSSLGFFRRSVAAERICMPPARNPTSRNVAGDPYLNLHFRSLSRRIFTTQRRHTTNLINIWFKLTNEVKFVNNPVQIFKQVAPQPLSEMFHAFTCCITGHTFILWPLLQL